MRWWHVLGRVQRSLYARIALIYLASLVAMSLATAWVAVSQFDQLGREWLQRAQVDLAQHLASVMQDPLRHGADSAEARQVAERIMTINPSLSLYVLNGHGRVIGAYAHQACGLGATVDTAPVRQLLSNTPMLPIYAHMPCRGGQGVFSAARVEVGTDGAPGYLFVALEANTHMSMVSMWRTSSIARSLIVAGIAALALSAAAGLLLFALLTRRFTRLTRAVQRFARGDYGQRLPTRMDDEIGRAGRAFNDMAATIEAQLHALRENDRQRRELVANLSHDFRTPLTSLRGYARQLRNGRATNDAERRAQLDAILANVERLTRLANQLSLLARVDVADRPLNVAPFSFAELAHDIVGKFRPNAEAAGIALSFENEAGVARVNADLELIDRALTNLIDNALAATDKGGTVTIKAQTHNGRLDVSVVDSGVGLSEEEIPLVTQRFYRTASGRERGDGTGLGLAIVAEVLERHGTRLTLESTPGVGTRALFTLPLAVDTR